MSDKITMIDVAAALEKVRGSPVLTSNQCWDLAQELNRAVLAQEAGHVEEPLGMVEAVAWRIPVSGEWFYGKKAECERERTDYESTFSSEDFEEAGIVKPEPLYTSPPAPVSVVLPERKTFKPHDFVEKRAGADGWNMCIDSVKQLNQSTTFAGFKVVEDPTMAPSTMRLCNCNQGRLPCTCKGVDQ